MEFLRAILGDDLYKQLETAVNAYNGDEKNSGNQIKIANLGGGEYVGRGKYDALNETLNGKQKELDSANQLITELKKSGKDNQDMQGKITAYETQVTALQKQLAETKLKSAVKVALLSEKCIDPDYMAYKIDEKLKEKGETLSLDENENIKGWDELIAGMKTQLPAQFESSKPGGGRIIEEKKLPKGDDNKPEPQNLAEALQMQYDNPSK